jgi:hypothetical protein
VKLRKYMRKPVLSARDYCTATACPEMDANSRSVDMEYILGILLVYYFNIPF